MSILETLDALKIEVVAFVDPSSPVTRTFRDKPVVRSPEPEWWADDVSFTVAIGDNSTRERVARDVLTNAPSPQFATLIHPSASVASSARLEPGAVVLQNGTVGAEAHVSTGVIVNSGAIVEHECEVEEYSSLGPGAVLGGRARVGRRSAIGIGATLKHGVTVGDDTIVGAGSYVHQSLPACVVAYGMPARVKRQRQPTEPYLG